MSYYIRTDSGISFAKVNNTTAGKMIKCSKGRWVEKNFKTGKATVFEFTEDFTYGLTDFKICIWEGFYMTEAL